MNFSFLHKKFSILEIIVIIMWWATPINYINLCKGYQHLSSDTLCIARLFCEGTFASQTKATHYTNTVSGFIMFFVSCNLIYSWGSLHWLSFYSIINSVWVNRRHITPPRSWLHCKTVGHTGWHDNDHRAAGHEFPAVILSFLYYLMMLRA